MNADVFAVTLPRSYAVVTAIHTYIHPYKDIYIFTQKRNSNEKKTQ